MQKEFFGYNTLSKLKDVIYSYSAKNIFLVTGRKSYSLSGGEEKIKPVLAGLNVTHFNSFTENPELDEVKHGISLYKKAEPDMVIAIGGGSVIDMAKMINVLSVQKKKPEKYITGVEKLKEKGKPLVAIPTTAGTGSEATYFATVYIDKTKYSVGEKSLTLPSVSIVDPSLTASMSKPLRAFTGLDALCQGIESFWAVGSTSESQKYAQEAVDIAFKNIEKSVKNPDRKTRMNMAKAANLSGKAICISKTTACHSISYPLTIYFGIPHGHAVSLTMPQIILFNSEIRDNDCNDKRGSVFVQNQIKILLKLLNCKTASDAKDKFENLMKKLEVETRLSKLNISKPGLDLIIEKGFTPGRMNNNPRRVTKEDLRNILDEIL